MMLTRKLALFLAVALLLPGLASGNDVKDFLWEGFLPIPDGTGEFVGATINTNDVGIIKDVDVDIVVEHTWQGDLIIELEHDGVRVPLIYRAGDSQSGGLGFSADNFGGPNGKFIFDDEAAEFYDSARQMVSETFRTRVLTTWAVVGFLTASSKQGPLALSMASISAASGPCGCPTMLDLTPGPYCSSRCTSRMCPSLRPFRCSAWLAWRSSAAAVARATS